MGIKNLHKFLKKNCIEVYEDIHISEFAYKKIAIDTSLYMCKYKIIAGDKWLSSFARLVSCLRKNKVHCVFIYDNGSPPEKELEKKERQKHTQKLRDKVTNLTVDLKRYRETGAVSKLLKETNSKKKVKNFLISEDEIDENHIETTIVKTRSQILNIRKQDFEDVKTFFQYMKIPNYNAILEAETTCVDLCKRGIVDAVLSEDSDVIAYGCPTFLTKINTGTGACFRIRYEKVLKSLELSSSEFLDFCIMCGSDYNKNIKGIGPEKSFKYIKTHSSIDAISVNLGLDVSILNHKRVRELFREYEKVTFNIPYCDYPDFEKLEDFIYEKGIYLDINGLKLSFKPRIVFIDDSGDEEDIEIVEDEESEEDDMETTTKVINFLKLKN